MWTECIDDGDAIEGMRRLFQRFEGWANRNFNQASSHSAHLTSHTIWERALPDYNGSSPTVHAVQAAISEQIFHGIFSRFMVALPERFWDNIFSDMDTEVSRSCRLTLSLQNITQIGTFR
jgi:hypothetical protein